MKAAGGWIKEKTLMLWKHYSAVAKTPVCYQGSYCYKSKPQHLWTTVEEAEYSPANPSTASHKKSGSFP